MKKAVVDQIVLRLLGQELSIFAPKILILYKMTKKTMQVYNLSFKSVYLSSSSRTILNSSCDIWPSFKAFEIKFLIEFSLLSPRVLIS